MDLEAEGNGEVILSSGFKLQASAAPTTSLPAPAGVTAGMGAGTGEISVGCQPVAKARTDGFGMREHDDTEVPGPWAQVKLASRSTAVITGLTPGKRYAFRIRVVGPNDIQSPWSVEISCMAP